MTHMRRPEERCCIADEAAFTARARVTVLWTEEDDVDRGSGEGEQRTRGSSL